MKGTNISARHKIIVILVTVISIAFMNIGGYIRVLFRFYVSNVLLCFVGGFLFNFSGKDILKPAFFSL